MYVNSGCIWLRIVLQDFRGIVCVDAMAKLAVVYVCVHLIESST